MKNKKSRNKKKKVCGVGGQLVFIILAKSIEDGSQCAGKRRNNRVLSYLTDWLGIQGRTGLTDKHICTHVVDTD